MFSTDKKKQNGEEEEDDDDDVTMNYSYATTAVSPAFVSVYANNTCNDVHHVVADTTATTTSGQSVPVINHRSLPIHRKRNTNTNNAHIISNNNYSYVYGTGSDGDYSNDHNNSQKKEASSKKDFRGGQEAWQAMFYNLMVYKVNHNNETNVKFEKENTPAHALYLWLQNQRKHYKYFMEGKPSLLNKERIAVLENAGVQWNIRGGYFWETMFEKLKEYKAKHKNTLVPRQWTECKQLGEWVTDQRRQHKYKINQRPTLLTDERERKLNQIGFTWSIRNRTDWNFRFEELKSFKLEHGHCVVPQHFSQNRALGKWVSKQREHYRYFLEQKQSAMTQERIDKLNELGFQWNAKGRRHDNVESFSDEIEILKATASSANNNDHDDDNNNDTEEAEIAVQSTQVITTFHTSAALSLPSNYLDDTGTLLP